MITYASEPESPVIELRVSGHITESELAANMDRMRVDLDAGKTRVIEIIEGFTGIEPAALFADVRLGLPLSRQVDRVAVVADQAWIRGLSHLGTLFTHAKVKVFPDEQLAEARSWIRDGVQISEA
ncbi:MAG: STAS/SEC14 domain-containing protein [Proteobacteria bacterium]|nr:STAS/SEC14 domain-containing protein [Pseudomonadota bacterium]